LVFFVIQILVKNTNFLVVFSLAKSRRTAKRPTVLSSLLQLLAIPITLKKIYFLNSFRNFCKVCTSSFLAKIEENQTFQGLNANGLEIKRRARRGMTLLVLTFICIMAAKKLNF